MPMNQPTQIALYRLLGRLRGDWHDAGLNAATKQLAAQPGTPFELVTRAVNAAAVARHDTPVCITWTGGEQPDRYRKPPRRGSCPDHGSTIRNAAGDWICCVQAAAEDARTSVATNEEAAP
jgi:hypothetical protein